MVKIYMFDKVYRLYKNSYNSMMRAKMIFKNEQMIWTVTSKRTYMNSWYEHEKIVSIITFIKEKQTHSDVPVQIHKMAKIKKTDHTKSCWEYRESNHYAKKVRNHYAVWDWRGEVTWMGFVQGNSLGWWNVLYLDFDHTYTDVYISQNSLNCEIKTDAFYCAYTTLIKLIKNMGIIISIPNLLKGLDEKK